MVQEISVRLIHRCLGVVHYLLTLHITELTHCMQQFIHMS